MTDLSSLLEQPTRDALVADLTELVDATVANQSGLTGMALKSAVAAGKRSDADAISKGIDQMLPHLRTAIEPYWTDYQSNSGSGDFGAYLADHEDDVVASILSVGDSFTVKAPAPIQAAYSSLRGRAGKIVGPALGDAGRIVEKHAS